ncbi:hypothetical protein HPB51_029663 [Rhipicephalus microplus]|uniref:Kinesin motor domain-containing protein n=1 Tax=Rhipicephalus microplus TaxID=6941 RepID=A0A9J6CU91_RHIMP|nr:hypothetical protein HPB51_029663 [Rhipicephalus microplus]
MLTTLLDGCNSSVFAYGATGAGETFTMCGSEECPGVVSLMAIQLNRHVDKNRSEGLERASAVNGSVKDLIREGTKVNLSMVAPSNCIDALSKSGAQRVPYRDSKLTHIMKDSSGGTCGTLMIAAVSPSKLS